MIAQVQALEAAALDEVRALVIAEAGPGGRDSDLAIRDLAAEIGAAVREPDRTIQRQIDRASALVNHFPETHRALSLGEISNRHVEVILECGSPIGDECARAEYEARVLDVARAESANRLRRFAAVAAEEATPRTLEERHEEAAAERCVYVSDLPDGMARLTADLPATLAHGIHDRLSSMGRALHAQDPGENRTLAQLRADLLADLALTGDPVGHDETGSLSEIRAQVSIVIPVLTLLGDRSPTTACAMAPPGDITAGGSGSICPESPATESTAIASATPPLLEGRQPIDGVTARRLAGASAGWNRILTHPITEQTLTVDRYRPSHSMRRSLQIIDERCRFPGCAHLARHCDLDHVQDAALGGATSTDNLSHLCRRHHILKHHTRWRVRKDTDGTITWTSPTQRQYPDRPIPLGHPPGVRFVPSSPPASGAAARGGPTPF